MPERAGRAHRRRARDGRGRDRRQRQQRRRPRPLHRPPRRARRRLAVRDAGLHAQPLLRVGANRGDPGGDGRALRHAGRRDRRRRRGDVAVAGRRGGSPDPRRLQPGAARAVRDRAAGHLRRPDRHRRGLHPAAVRRAGGHEPGAGGQGHRRGPLRRQPRPGPRRRRQHRAGPRGVPPARHHPRRARRAAAVVRRDGLAPLRRLRRHVRRDVRAGLPADRPRGARPHRGQLVRRRRRRVGAAHRLVRPTPGPTASRPGPASPHRRSPVPSR